MGSSVLERKALRLSPTQNSHKWLHILPVWMEQEVEMPKDVSAATLQKSAKRPGWASGGTFAMMAA